HRRRLRGLSPKNVAPVAGGIRASPSSPLPERFSPARLHVLQRSLLAARRRVGRGGDSRRVLRASGISTGRYLDHLCRRFSLVFFLPERRSASFCRRSCLVLLPPHTAQGDVPVDSLLQPVLERRR